jgi:hypothetical protein
MLRQGPGLVGDKGEHGLAQKDIELIVVKGELTRVGHPELDQILHSHSARPFDGTLDHALADVDPDNTAAELFGQVAGSSASATANLKHILRPVYVALPDQLKRGLQAAHVLGSADIDLQAKVRQVKFLALT